MRLDLCRISVSQLRLTYVEKFQQTTYFFKHSHWRNSMSLTMITDTSSPDSDPVKTFPNFAFAAFLPPRLLCLEREL